MWALNDIGQLANPGGDVHKGDEVQVQGPCVEDIRESSSLKPGVGSYSRDGYRSVACEYRTVQNKVC